MSRKLNSSGTADMIITGHAAGPTPIAGDECVSLANELSAASRDTFKADA